MAYAKINRVRLEREYEQKKKNVKLAHFFVFHYDQTISTILIGNNLVNIAASSMATILFINAYGKQNPNHFDQKNLIAERKPTMKKYLVNLMDSMYI